MKPMSNLKVIVSAFVLFFTTMLLMCEIQAQTLAFPTAEGFGKNTTGGRGGKLYVVSNLNDAGTGSFREAVSASGKRIVVFSVSGIIYLQSDIKISNGDLTIFGQTAPGDGICIANYTVQLSASNVIIRYMRFRPGSYQTGEYDASWGRNNSNIVLDHCSYSWGNDEQASFYDNTNFTMQYCIIAESFYSSTHPKGNHGFGGIWGGMGATFHHNLIANHTSRTPRFCGARYHLTSVSTEIVDFRNNVIFNWGYNSAYGGEAGNQNMVNNYYKPGPATGTGTVKYRIINPSDAKADGNPISKWYVSGNYMSGNSAVTADNWNGGVQQDDATITLAELKLSSPLASAGISTQTAADAYTSVLASAGCSLVRDACDQRVISSVKSGTSSYGGVYGANTGIIDNETEVGGYPTYSTYNTITDADADGMDDTWEAIHGTKVGTKDDAADANGDGYTNIEEYANCLVGEGLYCSTSLTYIYQNATTDVWTNTANWTPAAVPTDKDTAVIRTGEVRLTSNFGGVVKVETNGTFRLTDSISVTDLRLQGGTLKSYTSTPVFILTSTISVEQASTVMAGSLSASFLYLNGALKGSGNLTKTSVGTLRINAPGANYKGTWIVKEGRLQLRSATGLGLCGVEVDSAANLDVEAAASTNSIVLKAGGTVNLDANLTVQAAVFGMLNIPAGTYTASNCPAFITGSGTLTVAKSILTVGTPSAGSITLTAGSGVTYKWTTGVTTTTLVPSATGAYTVTATTSAGCKLASAAVNIQLISLTKGWNLISTNVCPTDSTTSPRCSTVSVNEIKTMDAFWRSGQTPAFNSLTSITTGAGYYVKMNAAGKLMVAGDLNLLGFQNLGGLGSWKLIGCPFQATTLLSSYFNVDNCSVIKNFDGYWKPVGTVNSITNLEPGKAYLKK